jgi:hypothetical protein
MLNSFLNRFARSSEGWFWVAAAICVVAALVILAWPWASSYLGRSKIPASNEIGLHQFLRFVGIDPMDRLPPSSNKAYNAFEKLRQLARDGKVRVKGKPGFKYRSPYMSWKPTELIDPIYWRDAQVFSLDVLGATDINNISTMPDDAMGKGKSQADVYKGLTLIEDDIKANFKENEFSRVKQ